MHRLARRGAAGVLGILLVSTARAGVAQERTLSDSTRAINLGEIVVRETRGRRIVVPFSEQRISLAAIQQRDASVVSDLAGLIPAAHVQTNSRGETLVYLRGAGERQVAVFFEGALLNIPWDNRVDLSLIPTSAIGGMTVAQGVPPVEYGANVLGGAINFTARRPAGNWAESSVSTRVGAGGLFSASVSHGRRDEKFSYTGSFSFARSAGRKVSSSATLPFSQLPGGLRTNTDFQVSNIYTSAVYEISRTARIGLTFLHMNADKGVAPEGHVDPAFSRVRFWRLPNWSHTTTILHGEGVAGQTGWKSSTWVTSFNQDIDSYASANYNVLEEREASTDLTFGSRLVVSRAVGPGMGKIALNALTSTHKQRDIGFGLSGNPMAGQVFPRLLYRQHILSGGAEYELPMTDRLTVTAGASLDAMVAPLTGDKPKRDAFVDYGATFGAAFMPSRSWFVRGAIGRKTRFPTLRELFGESLDRFLLNPGLRAESSILTELAVGVEGSMFSGELIPFGRFTSGAIDQQSVTVAGETRARRQRVNLRGSSVLGLEMVGNAHPADHWILEGHLTIMRIRRLQDDPTDPIWLSEKPEILGRVSVTRDWESGFSVLGETVYAGKAYSPDDNNVFVALDPSLVFNIRIEHQIEFTSWQTVRTFARADNVTDAVVLPQLGLPGLGRSVSGGLEFTF